MTKHQSQELEQLEATLQEWRRTRKSARPIPAEVWDGAIRLARQLSVGKIARRLRLDHAKLKRLAETNDEKKPAPVATFIEFPSTQFQSVTNTLSCALEIEPAGGSVMRARVEGVGAGDLGTIFKAFGN